VYSISGTTRVYHGILLLCPTKAPLGEVDPESAFARVFDTINIVQVQSCDTSDTFSLLFDSKPAQGETQHSSDPRSLRTHNEESELGFHGVWGSNRLL
jgi:hypothetical protein